MNRSSEHTEWTDRFSDYLAGELLEEEHAVVEDHLANCGGCRSALEQLREVVERAGTLAELQPSRDLWGGIAATIQAPAPALEPHDAKVRSHDAKVRSNDAKVIALPTTGASEMRVGLPRFAFTAPQLIAASLALIAASAVATWSASPALGVRPVTAPFGESAATMVSDPVMLPEGMAAELSGLESALDEARSALDPNTVRILERNLAVIEQAIQDSRNALSQDPGNEFLSAHLQRVYQRKLVYLRDATHVVEWAS